MRHAISILLVLLMVSGCAYLPGRRGGGAMVGLADKPVAAKEAPASFIAADGTRCLVSEEKFRNTAVGERVWCFWTRDGVQSVAGDRPDAASTRPIPREGAPLTSKPTPPKKPPTAPRP